VHFDHILCPVDLSPVSEGALRQAVALAAWYDADLTVLLAATAKRVASARQELAAFATAAGGTPRLLVTGGPPVREILRLASTMKADLIVMGTHGLTGVKRLLVGSVTERVLREASGPVLTVPPRAAGRSPETASLVTVVSAVDFSRSSTRAVDYAASVAGKAGARLVLLHALEWFDEEVEAPDSGVSTPRLPTAEEDARRALDDLLTADARACEDLIYMLIVY
jgi:nucleotide-binding universal stress UspA family protein